MWEVLSNGSKSAPDPRLAAEWDKDRDASLPVMSREGRSGVGLTQISLTPVTGPGTFEGEFGLVDGRIVMHFWPPGHAESEARNRSRVRFRPDFEGVLLLALATGFREGTFKTSFEADQNSWCVLVTGQAENLFWKDVCVRVLETLHTTLGAGSPKT